MAGSGCIGWDILSISQKIRQKGIEFQVQPVNVVTCLVAYAWEGYSLDSASPYSDNTTVISIILGF